MSSLDSVSSTLSNVGALALSFAREHPRIAGAAATAAVLFGLRAWSRRVRHGTVLELDLQFTKISETEHHNPFQMTEDRHMSLQKLLLTLDTASSDNKISGLVVKIGSDLQLGLASIHGLRNAILKFRKSGKFTVAFADTFAEFHRGLHLYYLASACAAIYLPPSGDLNLLDFVIEQPFAKGTLEKIGLVPRLIARKQYKNFPNVFTEDHFTDAHREVSASLINSVRDFLLQSIAESRGMEKSKVEECLRDGPFAASEAKIDDVLYRDKVSLKVEALANSFSPRLLFTHKYFSKRESQCSLSSGPVVAYLHLTGTVHLGESVTDFFGNATTIGSDSVSRALRAATKDSAVKLILMHVDSPGGSYVASDQIAHHVQLAQSAGKKVVVFMGNVAASGGYFISHYADKIIASPLTLTGSIGVFAGKFLTSELWTKLGVSWDKIHFNAAEHSDNSQLFSGLKDYSPHEQQIMDKMLDRIYEDFTAQVSRGRKLSREQVEEVAKGRVWTGLQAKQNGLVDDVGDLFTVFRIIREMLNLRDKDKFNLVPFPKSKSLLTMLASSMAENSEEQVTQGVSSLPNFGSHPLSSLAYWYRSGAGLNTAHPLLPVSGPHIAPLSAPIGLSDSSLSTNGSDALLQAAQPVAHALLGAR